MCKELLWPPFISCRDHRRPSQVTQGRACGPPRRGDAKRRPWL